MRTDVLRWFNCGDRSIPLMAEIGFTQLLTPERGAFQLMMEATADQKQYFEFKSVVVCALFSGTQLNSVYLSLACQTSPAIALPEGRAMLTTRYP